MPDEESSWNVPGMLPDQVQGTICQETQLECVRHGHFSKLEIEKFLRATLARAARNRWNYWREAAREARRLTPRRRVLADSQERPKAVGMCQETAYQKRLECALIVVHQHIPTVCP